MPKELLEAKKLELIQEKVFPDFGSFKVLDAKSSYRLTPRTPPKKLNGAKSKNGLGREILTTSGRESGLSEAEVVEEVTGHITITIDVLHDIRDLLLHGAGRHHTAMSTAGLHAVISWTRISLVTEVDDTRADVALHRPNDPLADLFLVRRRLQDSVNMTARGQGNSAPGQVDRQH